MSKIQGNTYDAPPPTTASPTQGAGGKRRR